MKRIAAFWLLMLLAVPAVGLAMNALVDAQWLRENLGAQNLVVLDIQEPAEYRKYHVPGAVNIPYSQWRTGPNEEPAGMLPSRGRLETLIGGAGIGNRSAVVIVPAGRSASDLAAAARVFWTFRVLNHETVAVLDGGLLAYARSAGGAPRLESGAKAPRPQTFKAQFSDTYVADADSTRRAMESGAQLVDARSAGEYVGVYVAGEGERPGTIPGAKNLPFDWVAANGSGQLRGLDELRALYAAVGVPESGDQVYFCHTGNRAALTWFVAHALFGNEDAKLYDASMAEWARKPELPVEQKIKLCKTC